MQSKQKNRIKPKIRARTFTITDYHYPVNFGHDTNFVPFIRLRGKWLKEASFHIGQKIKVYILKNRLIIVPYHRKP
ncbi:SymE family type I addiction module toxin [Odoribacter laneus]|mgnify:CR=1 FL=1|uniref:SymE family type I addiction module toxin n=1 Tax=Odoribacter laneus TaxID=626933 RepID=UPI00058FF2D9